MPLYRVFGLTIDSEWDLPSLLPAKSGPPDVVIRFAVQPAEDHYADFETRIDDRRRIIIEHDGIRYAVADGSRIDVSMPRDVDPKLVTGWLLGVGLGALLVQRGRLTLHANAVAMPDGKAVASFVGESGAGKSTLALQMAKIGHDLFGDDLLSIDVDGPAPCVDRGIPRIKLWRETLEEMGIGTRGLERVVSDVEKYELPLVDQRRKPETLPLRRIYVLSRGAHQEPVRIERVRGVEAGHLVVENAYRWQVAKLWHGGDDWAFAQCLALAANVEVFKVTRPWSFEAIDDVFAVIDQHLRQ